jgi:hypothetical protein
MEPDAIMEQLQSRWGDQFEERFSAASRVLGELFPKGEEKKFEWFEIALGRTSMWFSFSIVLAAMLDGNLPKSPLPGHP